MGGFTSLGGDICSSYKYGFAFAKLTRRGMINSENNNAENRAMAGHFFFLCPTAADVSSQTYIITGWFFNYSFKQN